MSDLLALPNRSMSVSCTSHNQTLWQLDDQVHYLRRLPHLWCLTINVSVFSLNDAQIFPLGPVRVNWPLPLAVRKTGSNKRLRYWVITSLSSLLFGSQGLADILFLLKTPNLFHKMFTCNLYKHFILATCQRQLFYTDMLSVYCFLLKSVINEVHV